MEWVVSCEVGWCDVGGWCVGWVVSLVCGVGWVVSG